MTIEITESDRDLMITYTNYRGETSVRKIQPKSIRYGTTDWHPEPQWLLLAFDIDKQADREFALTGFGAPKRDSSAERDPYGEAEQWGMQYALGLFGKHIAGVENWEGGDGSESVDGDVLAEFDNIAKAAGWINTAGDTLFGPPALEAKG